MRNTWLQFQFTNASDSKWVTFELEVNRREIKIYFDGNIVIDYNQKNFFLWLWDRISGKDKQRSKSLTTKIINERNEKDSIIYDSELDNPENQKGGLFVTDAETGDTKDFH